MKIAEGRCQIDGVDLGELKVDFLGPSITLNARYALVISSTGQKMGAGTRSIWNEEVQQKLRDLVEAMEREICTEVFGDQPTTDGVGSQDLYHLDDVPGL